MGDIVGDLFGGGGGGAAQAASPVQDVRQTAELPEWARGYAKDALAKGQALTDISQNPYQSYGGQRIADFGDLQKQAFAQAGPQGFGTTVGQYMSPYMQNVVDIQKREAARQSGIAGAQQAGQATMAGAFGGGRDAILRAERERNLMTQMGDIQQQGSQAAFDRATQQYNTGIGQLNTLGALQQAQAQRGLDIPYQEFLNQQNYPYKQLGFMSDLIRGLPVGQTSTKSLYEAAPSGAQQLASLGLGAYGLSKMMAAGGMAYADGGEVKGYAGDNGSYVGGVDSRENVEDIVHSLRGNPEALQRAYQAAQARGDMDQMEAIEKEIAITASLRRGIAGGITDEMATRMAGGGILAFQSRGEVDSTVEEDDADAIDARDREYSPGNPTVYKNAMPYGISALEALATQKGYVPMDEKTRRTLTKKNYDELQQFAGEDPYAPAIERGKKFEADLAAQGERGKGAVALQMARAVLRPGNQARAFGETAGVMGEGLAALDAAQAREKRALADYDFKIRDAQRKERMGLTKDAMGMTQSIETARVNADKATTQRLQAQGAVAARLLQATRPTGGAGGAGGKERDQAAAMRVYGADIKRQFPDMPQAQVEAQALDMYLSRKGSGMPGVEARTEAAGQKEARTSFNNRTMFGGDSLAKEYRAADKAGDTAKAKELRERIAAEEGYKLPDLPDRVKPLPVDKPEEKPAAKPAASPKAKDIPTLAKAAFGSYDASMYDYRINPDTGVLQRKRKE